MKVFLLHRDSDFQVKPELRDTVFEAMLSGQVYAIANAYREIERGLQKKQISIEGPSASDRNLIQDLELDTLWGAMAMGDPFLFEMSKRTVLSSLTDVDAIVYRQHVLADCLANPDTVTEIYALSIEALENERRTGGFWLGAGPSHILNRSVNILKAQVDVLKRLRQLADDKAAKFQSEGFTRFFAMLQEEVSDEYLRTVEEHLRALEFKRGLLESAQLGKGNRGRGYVVRSARIERWTERLPFAKRPETYGFSIPPRDESGFRALEDIRDRGLNHVANAVAQSADHVKSFFAMLRLELAFYLGCVNLREQLEQKDEPSSFPTAIDETQGPAFTAQGLYDVCLAFHLDGRVVGNDINADDRPLVMITGANQGGKSTFLRSVGLAQLMMQSGMFVAAESLHASVSTGVYSHYKREEDASMSGGKLDEELRRMSEIADEIKPNALLLCNESFASTNEREGSEIARQVIAAMVDKQIHVFFVTHMYDLAHSLHTRCGDALFLRAERQPDGQRTFRLIEGEPLSTSYGEDSYRRVFGASPGDAATRTTVSVGGHEADETENGE